MRLRTFLTLLGVVAIVAIIYSPSTIGASSGDYGSTSATDTGGAGTSQFVSLMSSLGYHVVLANNSQQEISLIRDRRAVLFIVGPDYAVNGSALQAIQSAYNSGNLSLFIADGNRTNNPLLESLYSASVSGAAIHDPTSPFQDNRVLLVSLNLSNTVTQGVMDIASPIILNSNQLHPVAQTSPLSVDDQNSYLGQRTVVAAGVTSSGSRSMLISDSSPFTNFLINSTNPANETKFVSSMVNWVTAGNRSVPIVYNDFDYRTSPFRLGYGVPVGPLFTYFLEDMLTGMNNYYSSYPLWVQGLFHSMGLSVSLALAAVVVGMLVLIGVYSMLTRWFAQERKGRDDQPLPNIERTVVAQSRSRIDFLSLSRDKTFYVDTLARLYEVLVEVLARELGADPSSLNVTDLGSKLSNRNAAQAANLLSELRPVYNYSKGRKRFLIPPILGWKRKLSKATEKAEDLLNNLGMTIKGDENTKSLEYSLRRR